MPALAECLDDSIDHLDWMEPPVEESIERASFYAPLDELTGMPIPVLNPAAGSDYTKAIAPRNWHHSFHPAKSNVLLSEPGGPALRACRVTLLDRNVHADYHALFDAVKLPQTMLGRFSLVTLAAAGFVPDQGLVFDRYGQPDVVYVPPEQREYLWKSRQINIWNEATVRSFMQQHVLEQDLSHVNGIFIDEFMNTRDDHRRKKIGYEIIKLATIQAAEPLSETYRTAKNELLLPPQRVRSPSKFLWTSLTLRKYKDKMLDQLEERLLAIA